LARQRFRLIVFSNQPRGLIGRWTPVTPASVEQAREALRAVHSDGGTNLYEGFKQGIENLDEGRTTALVLVSDGGANIGPTQHEDFLALMQGKGEPDEDRLEDGVAFAGVAKFPARIKCALLSWMAWKDATSQALAKEAS